MKNRRTTDVQPEPAEDFGPEQVLEFTGLAAWQWQEATRLGLITPGQPEKTNGRWPTAIAQHIKNRQAEIIAVVGTDAPLGGWKAARRLAERLGLELEKRDVRALADAGLVPVHSYYQEWPLYACADLDRLTIEQVTPVLPERRSRPPVAGPAAVDKSWRRRLANEAIKATGELLRTKQAAAYLGIRETDFRYLQSGGLVTPCAYAFVDVIRRRTMAVPAYRTTDLDALRDHPAIDWDTLRSVRPGQPSPLLDSGKPPLSRGEAIRRWVTALSQNYGIEAWTWWNNAAGRWEIDFERTAASPTIAEVRRAFIADPCVNDHAGAIALETAAGQALRWARAMQEPGAAVILDTETTGLSGFLVEIAVVDAATGETLLHTLVNPGCTIEDGARQVHGLSDEDVAGAPTLAQVLPQLLAVTAGRTILAYNADFDAEVLIRHCERDGLPLGELRDNARWACLMDRRSDWSMVRWWLPLMGGHRAVEDCRQAYELLCAMTTPAYASERSAAWARSARRTSTSSRSKRRKASGTTVEEVSVGGAGQSSPTSAKHLVT